jgi:hypothetical protein
MGFTGIRYSTMTRFDKPALFPEAYIPGGRGPEIPDPFGSLMRSTAPGNPQMPVTGGGGGGTPVGLDLDVRNGITGAVLSAGTQTLTMFGKSIYWVQMPVNNNGTASSMLFLASLPY